MMSAGEILANIADAIPGVATAVLVLLPVAAFLYVLYYLWREK